MTLIFEALIEELRGRDEVGYAEYGRALTTWNGREPYADARDELLDQLVYNKQAQLERDELLELLALAFVHVADKGLAKRIEVILKATGR